MKNKKVLIIDDVLTAGTALKNSIKLIQESGGTISAALMALDRQEQDEGEQVSKKLVNELNIPINELTKKYTNIYNADMSYLNVLHPDIQPKATEYVEDMINFIDKLIQKDKAYEKDGHVFFHVPSHEGYGKLSNREIDQQLAGSRVQV